MPDENDVQIDMGAALEQMDAEFGPSDNGGTDEGTGAPQLNTPTPAPATSTPPSTPPTGAPQDPWRTPPKSWKADYSQYYSGLDPKVQQYIHEREKQALDGIMHYKSQYDPYHRMAEQYKPWLERNGAKLDQVAESMIRSHIALVYGNPQMKMQYAQKLINDYGLGPYLQQMFGRQQGGPQMQQPHPGGQPFDPRMIQSMVQEMVRPVMSKVQSWEQAKQQEALEATQKEIDAFLADPQNEYAGEVLQDMVDVVKKGLATDLKSAYELACKLNPTVSAKVVQREIEKAAGSRGPRPRNVNSGQTPPSSTKAGAAEEDLEDTMRSTLRDIKSR